MSEANVLLYLIILIHLNKPFHVHAFICLRFFTGGEKIVHTTLTKEGIPLLTVSSGKSFSFAPHIASW